MKLPLRLFAAVALAVTLSFAQSAQPSAPAAGTVPAPSPVSGPAPVQPAAESGAAPAGGVQPVVQPPTDDKASKTEVYVIGPLDVLDIRVWNDPKTSATLAVRPDGIINMPLVGELKADGLTIAELTRLLTERLSAFMNEPRVNIQLGKIGSKKYYVYGGVLRGGEFPLLGEMRVLDAFANTGGFKDFSNPKKIYILRGDQKLKFNYKDVSKGKNMEQNILLKSGDRIFVPE